MNDAVQSYACESAVRVGCRVRVRDCQDEDTWHIVASHEADALRHRISEESPMARALLGHRVGDRIRVRRPDGTSPVTILAVD